MISSEDLEHRVKRLESATELTPYEYDVRIPSVQSLRVLTKSTASGVTTVVVGWESPLNSKVDRYEIWLSRSDSVIHEPSLQASVHDSPAWFSVSVAAGVKFTIYLRTVMKNGLSNPVASSPTTSFVV